MVAGARPPLPRPLPSRPAPPHPTPRGHYHRAETVPLHQGPTSSPRLILDGTLDNNILENLTVSHCRNSSVREFFSMFNTRRPAASRPTSLESLQNKVESPDTRISGVM